MLPIAEAVQQSDVVMMLVPDEAQPGLFAGDVARNLKKNAYLGFAHGLAIHFKKITAPPGANVFMVAPRGPGDLIRKWYVEGQGFVCSLAVAQDPAGDTRDVAAAYARAIGVAPDGAFETTFGEECQADLFGEQAVLCGGLVELVRSAYETLTEAGFSPQMAYFECLHEVKLIADLLYEWGIAGMRSRISNTAKYGGLTRGPRVIGPQVKQAMKSILAEIRSGAFADEWLAEYEAGLPKLQALQATEADHPIEAAGQPLREAVLDREPQGQQSV